jgi:hypothetical protein
MLHGIGIDRKFVDLEIGRVTVFTRQHFAIDRLATRAGFHIAMRRALDVGKRAAASPTRNHCYCHACNCYCEFADLLRY